MEQIVRLQSQSRQESYGKSRIQASESLDLGKKLGSKVTTGSGFLVSTASVSIAEVFL